MAALVVETEPVKSHPASGSKLPSPSSTNLVTVTEDSQSSRTIWRSAAASWSKSAVSVKSDSPNGLPGYWSNPETAFSRLALLGFCTASPTPSAKTCDPFVPGGDPGGGA